MAIVKTTKMHLWGKEFVQKIKCNNKGKFSCELPQVVQQVFSIKEVTGNKIEDVEVNFSTKIRDYDNSVKQVDKFILPDFSLNATILKSDFDNSIEKKAHIDQNDILFTSTNYGYPKKTEDISIRYNYDIVERTICNNHTTYKSLRKKDYVNDYGIEKRLIPWTSEREEFYKQIEIALKRIIIKLNDFTNVPVDEVIKIIDAGAKLIGGQNEK